MVRRPKTVTVNYSPQQSFDTLRILGVYASVRFILNIVRMDFGKGLVVLVEESEQIPEFVKVLTEELGAVIVKNMNSKKFIVPNNRVIVHVFHKYDSREAVAHFLEEDKFFPVLVVGGVIPEDIEEAAYIVKAEHTLITRFSNEHIQEELRSIEDFVKNNFPIIQRELNLLKTSEQFITSTYNGSAFWVGLMAAEKIFELYFRNLHSEYDTQIKAAQICEVVNACILKDREVREKEDVADAVKKIVFDCLMDDPDLIVGNLNKIEGDLVSKLKMGTAIICDTDFYFVPETIFRSACSSLLRSVSFTEIKRQLKDNGYLVCNNTDTTNFTVKKVIITLQGEKIRERFLKVRKEFFLTYEGLELKDLRREVLCTSEK